MVSIFNNDEQKIVQPVEQGQDNQSAEVVDQVSAKDVDHASEQMREKLQNFIKQVAVTDIGAEQKERFNSSIHSLESLKNEINDKKSSVIEKKEFIKQKMLTLKNSQKVTIDENEFVKSEKSVAEYVRLLDKMVIEIERDITYYTSLISSTPPEHVMVLKSSSDSFEDYVQERIANIKKYIKTETRDLAVSYSRYCFGFDAQIRQIAYVEQVLHRMNEEKESAS